MMKKELIKKILFVVTLCVMTIPYVINATEPTPLNRSEVSGAYYEVNENQETRILDGGITYIRDTATSHADNIAKDSYGCSELNTAPQQVNVLKIPTSKTLKVVNWRASTKTYWKKTTVVNLAKDFEANNPGWVVIAGTNGDFFDINGNFNLPYQTNSTLYSNGEMYRSLNNAAVGFKNDGEGDQLVYGTWQTTDLQLQIYNENNEIIGTYDITHKNEQPDANGVAVYFQYPESKGNLIDLTIPAQNSYTVENGYMLSENINELYAKGQITYINQEVVCNAYQFAVVTTNEEITSKLSLGTTIRIQKNVIGDYAECDNATGVGVHLLKDGEALEMNDFYRHPRTTVGMTADGEIVLMTVDGRQTDKNMYGMTYQELQATMLYYGCTDLYNMDGGGSTTMIIRNAEGNFDVMNSPSDGNERADANAVLIVAPRMDFKLKSVTDTGLTITYPESNEVQIANILLHIDNKEIPVDANEFTYNQLQSQTSYDYYLSYDLTFDGETTRVSTASRNIKTGKLRPTLTKYNYQETEDTVTFNYQINDPDSSLTFAYITVGRKMFNINTSANSYTVSKSKLTSTDYKMVLEFSLSSSTGESGKETYTFQKKPDPVQLVTPVITLNGNTISWETVDNAVGYAIYDNGELLVANQQDTSYDLSNLKAGTHNLTVVALGDNDLYCNSENSNEVIYVIETIQLASPVITLNGNTISWEAVDNASGYAIYQGLEVITLTELYYEIGELSVGTYSFTVVALGNNDKYLDSAASNVVEYVVEPTRLASVVITLSGNVISWEAVENASGYAVYDNEVLLVENQATISYDLSNLKVGIHNIYVVALSNNENYLNSATSNVVEYVVEPTKLANVVITLTGNIISWEAVENASGYAIYDNETLLVENHTSTSYDLSGLAEGTHNIKVVALSDNEEYLDSDESITIEYSVVIPEPAKGCKNSCKKKSIFTVISLITSVSVLYIIFKRKH